jgi:hypothetical protein
MENLIKISFVLLFTIVLSCTKKNEVTNITVTNQTKILKEVTISNKCFQNSFIYDSLLVLIADCDSYYFHVYNKLNLNYITKFGKKGRSPHEFFYPLPYITNTSHGANGSIFKFFDLNLKQEKIIDFSKYTNSPDSKFITSRMMDKNLSSSIELNQLNNGCVAGKDIDFSGGLFFIYDSISKNKKWVDFIPKLKIEEKYRVLAYYGLICSNSNRIFYASRHFDEVLFFDNEGKLLKEYYFSEIKKPILSKNFSGVASESPVYSMRSFCSDKYCYIIKVNLRFDELKESLFRPVQVLQFNWEGNLVKTYILDSLPKCFCVDENENTMYLVSADKNSGDILNLSKLILE